MADGQNGACGHPVDKLASIQGAAVVPNQHQPMEEVFVQERRMRRNHVTVALAKVNGCIS